MLSLLLTSKTNYRNHVLRECFNSQVWKLSSQKCTALLIPLLFHSNWTCSFVIVFFPIFWFDIFIFKIGSCRKKSLNLLVSLLVCDELRLPSLNWKPPKSWHQRSRFKFFNAFLFKLVIESYTEPELPRFRAIHDDDDRFKDKIQIELINNSSLSNFFSRAAEGIFRRPGQSTRELWQHCPTDFKSQGIPR